MDKPTTARAPAEPAPARSAHRKSRLRRLTTGALVSVVTTAVLLGLVEVGVRVLVPPEIFSPFKPIYRPDPVAGYTLRPGIAGDAFGAELRTNALGFRGPEWPETVPAGQVRIALLGDSHAFGFGVPLRDSVGEVLARRLDRPGARHQVLNFALPGYNTRQQLAILRGHVLGYRPDLVLVLACENDHEPARWADREGWLHRGDDDTALVPTPLASERHLLRWSRAFLYGKLLWRRYRLREAQGESAAPPPDWTAPGEPGPISDELRDTVYRPLLEMARACAEQKVPMVVATLAARADYRRMFATFARETGVPAVDLLRAFPEARSWTELFEKFGLGWDDHLDARGHRRWADALVPVLRERGF